MANPLLYKQSNIMSSNLMGTSSQSVNVHTNAFRSVSQTDSILQPRLSVVDQSQSLYKEPSSMNPSPYKNYPMRLHPQKSLQKVTSNSLKRAKAAINDLNQSSTGSLDYASTMVGLQENSLKLLKRNQSYERCIEKLYSQNFPKEQLPVGQSKSGSHSVYSGSPIKNVSQGNKVLYKMNTGEKRFLPTVYEKKTLDIGDYSEKMKNRDRSLNRSLQYAQVQDDSEIVGQIKRKIGKHTPEMVANSYSRKDISESPYTNQQQMNMTTDKFPSLSKSGGKLDRGDNLSVDKKGTKLRGRFYGDKKADPDTMEVGNFRRSVA